MPLNWLEFSFNMIRWGEHLPIINDLSEQNHAFKQKDR